MSAGTGTLGDVTDDDVVITLSINRTMEKMVSEVGYPALRLLGALAVIWIASGASS